MCSVAQGCVCDILYTKMKIEPAKFMEDWDPYLQGVPKKGRKVNDRTNFDSCKRADLIGPISRLVQQVFVRQVLGQG